MDKENRAKWLDIDDVLPQDHSMIEHAFAWVRRQPRPSNFCSEYAHSAERENWEALDLTSTDDCCQGIRPGDIFILSDEGLAYYAPVLLALCLLRKDGHYQQVLFTTLRKGDFGFGRLLPRESRRICLEIIGRIERIMVSLNPDEVRTYTGLAVGADPENKEIHEGLVRMRQILERTDIP